MPAVLSPTEGASNDRAWLALAGEVMVTGLAPTQSSRGFDSYRPCLEVREMKKTRVQHVQELRRSSASQPHRNKKRYSRKDKHRHREQ